VARRFGAALVDALDQAYGTRADVYPWLTLPDVFEARLELTADVDSAPALLFGACRLLAQLAVWLQMRQRGVLAIELGWMMDARRNTAHEGALVLRTAEASADVTHLQRLLAERLGQVTLPAPVHSLRLRSLETQMRQGASASLLLDDQPQGDSLAHLLERLSARLGPDKVLCLQAQADHRPEQMQAWVPAARYDHPGVAGATPVKWPKPR
jgi:protein ImuB